MKALMTVSLALLILTGAFARQEGGREFVVAFYPTEINFNPLNAISATEAQIYTALYEGLVSYHPLSLDPLPAVARSWDISPDGRTYTFRLRENARYWNGDQVTAEDFRQSWLMFLDPNTRAEYSFLYDVIEGALDYRTGRNPDPNSVGIRALDRFVLEVRLIEPADHFLKILSHHSFMPIHPSLREVRDWNALPTVLGNGPFYIVNHSPAEIELRRNELYWDARRVRLQSLRMLFIDDADLIARRFNAGEIHWIAGGVPFEKILDRDSIKVNPMFATQYFYFSTRSAPFDDPDVRRALALLAPWDKIRDREFVFIPAVTLVPPIPFYPTPETIEGSDVGEALRLLSERGFPLGRGLPPPVIRIPESMESLRVAAHFAAAWKQHLGLDTIIETFPHATYFTEGKQDGLTLGTLAWIGDFADPLTFLKMWTSDSNLNTAGFVNEEYDRLVYSSIGQSGAQRFQTLADAESILLRTAVVLPISHSPAVNIIDLTAVDGWFPNPLDIHPFKHLGFTVDRVPRGVVQRDVETNFIE